jgi:hypothetical protein
VAEVLIEGYRLDVKDGLDFSFNYSIADVRDPNKRSTSYSKTIKCPSTKANDILFGNIWEINIANAYDPTLSNVNVNFNPNKKAEARVVHDGVEVMVGVVQLRQVTIQNTKLEYEVVFIGKLKNIFSVLGDKQLNDVDDSGNVYIDFSDLDHFLTEPVLTASWNNTSGYTYPMIDYGLAFNYDTQGRRIYDVEDFRPAVFLKTVVDKIFDFAGFTYTSTFFDSAPFNKLIVPWYKESFTLTEDQVTARQFTARSTSDYDLLTETPTVEVISGTSYDRFKLAFDDLNDPSNLYDDTTYLYSPATIGYVEMFVDMNFTITRIATGGGVVGAIDCAIIVKKISNSVESIVDILQTSIDIPDGLSVGSTSTTAIQWSSTQDLLFVGDVVWVEIIFQTALLDILNVSNRFSFNMDTGANLFNQVAEEQVFEGSNVYMNNFVPDIGMSDLLLSVFKMFNLYVTVDPLDETNLIIETRDTYYNGGTIRDWSHKLAKDQPVIVKPLGLLTAKEYIYTYSDDGDYYNKRFEDLRGYNYGRSRTEIDNDFINSTTKVEIDFSPTPLVNDGVTSRIIPKVYDEDISTGAKPVDMNTRVLYFDNTLVSNPSWILRYNGGNNTAPKSTYPYAGHWDNPITPSLDLNFGIPTQLFYTENGYTGTLQVTNANLVNVYHRGYLNEITNKDSKVLSASFYLDAWDIAKLDFRDQILLNNSYWRLNKVTDYNPFKESLTKVELIKVLDVIQTPVETFRLGEKGADSYGEKLPVTNIKERLGRNLFNPFTGMVNGTGNKVNDSASAFKIVGDNNYIGAASKNVTITGNNNQVLFGASNVVIINSDDQVIGSDNTAVINNQVVYCETLDSAYDGCGAGLGRTITADAGAVEIIAANTDSALNVEGYSSLSNTDISNNSMFFGIQADDEPLTYFAIYQGDDGTLTGMKLDKDGGQHLYQGSTGNTAHGGALSDGYKVGASGATYWGKMWLEYDQPSRLKSELASNALQYAELAVTPYMVSVNADESEINCSLKVITTTGAFTPPILTTTERNALTPTSGMVIYNSTDSKHQGYDGTSWNNLY